MGTHTQILYRGGVYRAAAVLEPRGTHRADATAYFYEVGKGLLWIETILASGDADAELAEFWGAMVWPHQQLYREVVFTNVQCRGDYSTWKLFIFPVAGRVHSCLSTEKGVEDLFNAWRHISKKSTNGISSLDRYAPTHPRTTAWVRSFFVILQFVTNCHLRFSYFPFVICGVPATEK